MRMVPEATLHIHLMLDLLARKAISVVAAPLFNTWQRGGYYNQEDLCKWCSKQQKLIPLPRSAQLVRFLHWCWEVSTNIV